MKLPAWALLTAILTGLTGCPATRGQDALPVDGRQASQLLSHDAWKVDGLATQRFEIHGTGERSNPLRRALTRPFDGNELFVRFRLNYAAQTIDTPEAGDGEFFVLWLDSTEGNHASTHSGGVPNIGIHVQGAANRWMVRFGSGDERFGPELEGDRDILIVARLWKSMPGTAQPFDQMNLWVNPERSADAQQRPHASVSAAKAISVVNWIGFSTARKTEFEDRIEVWDIDLAPSWQSILNLPETPPQQVMPEPVVIQKTIDFSTHVLPILKSHCFECHSGLDAVDGIRLDVLDEVLNQTAPRDAGNSHLFQLVSEGKMPPEGLPLDKDQLTVLRTWIDEGLDWDEQRLPTPVPESDHWAFQPLVRPDLPAVRNAAWIRTAVDTFIAQQHEVHGLVPAERADPGTRQRRLSLDLLGLPEFSRPAQLETAQYIDALLKDPAYGERWGRHWLDVARWAESNGHQHNRERPHAWRYRDWVIHAFQSDKPYDEFLREQIAGDELQPLSDDRIIATGFLSAARYSGNELDKKIQRNDILVDITNTTSAAVLGLTLECAQCHTHKFDPLSIRDYYRFQACFAAGQPNNVVLESESAAAASLVAEHWQIYDTEYARLLAVKRGQGIPDPIYISPETVTRSLRGIPRARFLQLNQQLAEVPQSWSYYSPSTASGSLAIAPHEMRWPLSYDPEVLRTMQTPLLIRGDVGSPGPNVQPGWPAVFGPTPAALQKPRTALAEWMTRPDNPLTARVWVNRIWQWHFGRGLVETSNDFGTQGTPPTHPRLLDFLASELIDHDWSTRHIQRLILNSATYQQSSQYSAANAAVDPDNKYLWRWTPRRLEAEAIRDSVLAVSGQLDLAHGGPSVPVDAHRRAVYLKQRRDAFPHQQLLFDSAGGNVSCSRRRISTTSLQPLWLMNSPFMQQAAEQFAERAGSVADAVRLAYGRDPENDEVIELQNLADQFGLASACLAILNSSEFMYVP